MGKASRKHQHAGKMAEKARRKEAKRALYKSYSERGQINKAKVHRTESSGKKGQHVMKDCGNTGCIKCYPHLNNYCMNNGVYRLPDFKIKLSPFKVEVQ